MFKYKKAAMFGLDARIALAIFGALSVISGAALYSAIKQSRTEAWRQYFEETIKASQQYYLDTGHQLPISTSTVLNLILGNLAKNVSNQSSWKGPYLLAESLSFDRALVDIMTKKIGSSAYTFIALRDASDWSEMNDETSDEHCVVDSTDCAEWISIIAITADESAPLKTVFDNLDELVDNSDGYLKGKVRYNTYLNGELMYKGMNHIRR